MFTSATSSGTTTITNRRGKFSQPTHHNTKPTLTPQSLRTIATAVASAPTPVPASARSNPPTYIHAKDHHNGMQKIFCYGCEQTKSRMAFSISQLNKMVSTKGAPQRALKYGGGTGKAAHQPLCKDCTPAEVTMLKCTNCSRIQLLEMFSKSQRRRQKDGSLICVECRKELDVEEVVVWSEDEEDYQEKDDKEWECVGEEEGGGGDSFESMCSGGWFEEMKPDWSVEAEKGDPDWHNGTLNDIFL